MQYYTPETDTFRLGPIYRFDEWASDRDPIFREVFYKQTLLEPKQQGKTVLVISHDDRYFHLADQLIKLECGLQLPVE